MNHLQKNHQALATNLMEQFKRKGYSCSQVKEKEVTVTIFKHGKRQEKIK